MSTVPVISPVPQPEADSPLISPPVDALPPVFPPPPPSDTTVPPPIASEPPPADSPPAPPTTSTPATPSSSQTPSPPISQKPTSNSSAKSPPSPPILEWTSSSSSKSSNSPSSEMSSASMAIIAGVVVGGVAILAILGIFLMCCARKKRKDQIGPKGYYVAAPPGKDGNNSGHMQNWQQSNPPSSEYRVSNLPPPPGSGFRPPHPQSRNSSMPHDSYMSGGNSGPAYKGSDNPNMPLSKGVGLSFSKSTFSYEELAMATNGFSKANYLGQGGFGSVYKGFLQDGREVAIKSLKADSGQGEREFQAEIDVISRVHHKHLVTLVGYCISGNQRMLVYEFVANNTLEFHLYGKGRPTMDWPTRMKIALGAAKGLAYLHEDCHPKIIHRDIKGANILIDSHFEAKVADFGLAKFTEDANTHVSTRVMGTFGYLAPEYAASGKLTEKSDVFSFGVMLLEFITGRRPVDRTNSYMDDSLVDWARPYLDKAMEDGNFEALVDPKLQNSYNHDEMARMVACAAGATSHSAKRRPKMSQIVRALDSTLSLSDLNDGMTPGESRVFHSHGSPEYPRGQYKEDMKRFRKVVLQTQDNTSTEYTTTGTTSEYSVAYTESSSGSHTTQEMEMAKVKKDRNFN